ncbi:MAG TPA: NAD-glutamate dehydrogenase [Alphaproteobacteria bacterium]|nr:NAD-glutamate dehydrogenase [Alphaproteobacteria bacterium]
MLGEAERRKSEILQRVVELARTRLSGAKGAAAAAFVERYYANVAAEDLADATVDDLYGGAIALWQFGRARKADEAKVRVYNPRLAEHGWSSRHTVIEIVNDDMPFLVDSVTAEINRREITVHLVIHPIVRVKRDDKGSAGAIADDGVPESFMHVEIDEQGGSDTLAELQSDIVRILADVRAAVGDWKAMLARMNEVIGELAERPPPVPAGEIESARAFLSWLANNHFTFLGYREYEFSSEGRANVVARRGLGLCRDDALVIFDGLRNLSQLPPDVQEFVRQPRLLKITKSNRRSTVHRAVHFDTIGVKKFGAGGKVAGERVFLGLFTSAAYSQRPRDIPLLADKVRRIIDRAGFAAESHDGKALANILETFPRDELFQASDDELFETALGVLRLQERQRTALFVRRDPFERFISALVYVPRDRYSTTLRLSFQTILEDAFGGAVAAFQSQFADESVLARIHFIVKTTPGAIPHYSVEEITRRLVEAGRSFADRLKDALTSAHGEDKGLAIWRRYAEAFPAGYRERFAPEAAVADIAKIETVLAGGARLALNLYRDVDSSEDELRFRVYGRTQPVPLSDILPMLENFGIKVMSEVPYRVDISGAKEPVWMQDFAMTTRDTRAVDLADLKGEFEEAFAHVWAGALENDGFNRLVIAASLSAREVTVVRAYARYLRQVGIPFSQAYMEDTLAGHAKITRRLVDLFLCLHDPAERKDAGVKSGGIVVEVEHLLDEVASLDEDRILRRFLNLIRSTLRTNFFQRTVEGGPKAYVALKLDSRRIDELPLPRPHVEIFVYSPQVEAVHLRGGKVARGGIRWSDRREDFRTEVLGLMKAQMVKNAVIVPVGSKGGFFVKRPPPADAGREAQQAEGIACYKTMMRGLLDVTDNLTPSGIAPPQDVVRHDDDDPYLVVAADKGTATFSDIANGVAREYGFWLDDAFASGGSAGYDHKGMGITARGAWEAVKRHFRELGHDTQSQDFTVIGVGDMSGDVFGNGMLQSKHIKLLGAFDHRHIFLDPAPDPAISFAERERIFKLPRSSWADYDAKLISAGGGVFDRKAKAIKLSPELKQLLDLSSDQATPADVMKMMLKAPVDLLWLGGIGNYVKAADESHAEVGDRANDALRIDGRDVRARVMGEGANLGVTQRGRVEYAVFGAGGAGGSINTDAIDNSAGVDTSDHEVNIKILLGDVVQRGDMTIKQRDQLLAKMTDEVGLLVLRDNYLQTQAISLAEAEGAAALDRQVRMIRAMEKTGRLNRAIEFLPDDEEIANRQTAHRGLTRPELAVIFAYAKLALYDALLPSQLPDDPALTFDLVRYFPSALRKTYREAIMRHRLRREIIATSITNSLTNRCGPTFVNDLAEETGASPVDAARAYLVVREIFEMRPLWMAIEALDNKTLAAAQYRLLRETMALVERAATWFVRHAEGEIDVAATIARYQPGVAALQATVSEMLDPGRAEALARRAAALAADGVPAELATRVAGLADLVAAPDLAQIAQRTETDIPEVARVYYAIGARLGFDWLREAAQQVKTETAWQKLASRAIVDDLFAQQADLAERAVRAAGGAGGVASGKLDAVADRWVDRHKAGLGRFDARLSELKTAGQLELAALAVASRELRALTAPAA